MPRYHFNVEDGHSLPDPDGIDLPDLGVARYEAARLAGRLLEDNAGEFWRTAPWRVSVTDGAGVVLFRLVVSADEGPGRT